LWDCVLDAMTEFRGAVCGADAILELVRLPRTSIAR